MTREDVKELIKAIMTYYPNFLKEEEDVSEKVDAWYFIFKEDDADLIRMALASYVSNTSSSFAPVPGALRNIAYDLIHSNDMDENEAWQLIKKAYMKGASEASNEFKKLPLLIQKTIGTPSYLRDLAYSCNEYSEGQFKKMFKATAEREKYLAMLPSNIRAVIEDTSRQLEQSKQPKLEGIEQMKGEH